MSGTTSSALDGPPRPASPVDHIVDRLLDLLVLGFGLWTVLYHLACWLGARTTPLLVTTAVGTAAAGLWLWRRPPVPGGTAAVAPTRSARVAATASLALAAVAVAILAWGDDAAYPWGWGLGLASLVPLVVILARRDPSLRGKASAVLAPAALPSGRWPAVASSVVVVAVGLGFAVLSLFVVNVSFDDVFYVNKAVFVAEHGTIPLRDTVYSDQVLPALRGAGTVPVQSVEVLQGALAHVFGVAGGTVVYLVTPFVGTLVATWVVWALVRAWSRGPAVVAFLVAAAYLAWGMWSPSGATGSIAMSSIFLRAMWQGKVLFLFLAVPLCHLLLTRWARERRIGDLVLLLLLGAGATGLTSSATFLVPPIAAGAAVALAACRNKGWFGPLLLAAYPVGAGVFVAAHTAREPFGQVLRTPAQAFHGVVGAGLWGAIGASAILAGPMAVRSGAPRVLATSASVVTMVVLAPFSTPLLADLTGAGPVLWRLPWVVPLPALVGVLAVGVVPSRLSLSSPGLAGWRRPIWLGWLVPVVVVVLIVVSGRLIWAPGSAATLAGRPVWKFPSASLDRAAYIARIYAGPGTVLAPREVMSALALTTTRIHAVDPRPFFISSLDEDPRLSAGRRLLSLSMAEDRLQIPKSFAVYLDNLHVGLVCPGIDKARARQAVEDLGWQPLGDDPSFPCYRRPG
ncbi:MAG TPA: hypothetical protein VFX00_13165 [Pedococcus sp.]|nr:hypothetical protein [Pedococcus sp.]